jgi:Ribbon-helix-helix protein, copG family
MADGFSFDVDAELAERLSAAAADAGVSREAYVRALLEQESQGGPGWVIARARAYDFDRTGEAMTVDEAFAELDALVLERRARNA